MRALIIAACVAVTGCASATMERFVGRTIQDGVVQYGPPANVFDMPDGRRAFQWQIDSTVVMPGHSFTSGTANIYGAPGPYGTVTAQSMTTTMPAYVAEQRCLYTMYATWNESLKTWVFVGFEKPRLSCQ